MTRSLASIFDLLKIGPGPSSSHSIGPRRAMQLFLKRMDRPPSWIRVTLQGSLAATGRGHLTDRALIEPLGGIPHELIWDTETRPLPHPNTLCFEAFDEAGNRSAAWTVFSVGGGNLADAGGPVDMADGASYPAGHLKDIMRYCRERGLTYWELVRHCEPCGWSRLLGIWQAMAASVERGLYSAQDVLPGPLRVPRKAPGIYQQAHTAPDPQRDLALMSAFALAVAEENAAGGLVVTAPSCGASGVLPAVLYYFRKVRNASPDQILAALATAGLFGLVIRANASLSGAVVGCQGEVGSACSMAAAAAAQLLGGNLEQIEYAAEIAMEHHLGLTCDPVAGFVQIPCIERNMAAAWRAYESAVFAVLTDGRHLISFDDVIEVMAETGRDLQSKYRETARGGLALLWEKRLHKKGQPAPVTC